MTMTWSAPGEREVRNGLDHGALYVGTEAVPWNGLISVEESVEGGGLESHYYDGQKYHEQIMGEDFTADLRAYMWPPLFDQCLGYVDGGSGLFVSQQRRKRFNLAYRVQVGTDLDGDAGYELHLVWNALVQPVVKSYETRSDTVNPSTFSFKFTSTPPRVNFPGYVPSGHIVLDSRIIPPDRLTEVEDGLFGDGVFPTPTEVIIMVFTLVDPLEPMFEQSTNTITIEDEDSMFYVAVIIDDGGITHIPLPPGTHVLDPDETKKVKAKPKPGYYFPPDAEDEWDYSYGGAPIEIDVMLTRARIVRNAAGTVDDLDEFVDAPFNVEEDMSFGYNPIYIYPVEYEGEDASTTDFYPATPDGYELTKLIPLVKAYVDGPQTDLVPPVADGWGLTPTPTKAPFLKVNEELCFYTFPLDEEPADPQECAGFTTLAEEMFQVPLSCGTKIDVIEPKIIVTAYGWRFHYEPA